MGLFSRTKAKVGEIGNFRSAHQAGTLLGVVYHGVAGQLSQPAPTVSGPAVMESIYLSRYDDSGLTVTAGNSAETYFVFSVDLSATPSGTDGHAYFDRPSSAIRRGAVSAIHMHIALRSALDSASVTLLDWDLNF